MPVFTAGSPNSNNLELGIAIVLKDRFSNQAREASTTIKKLHQDAKNAISANLHAANSMSMVGMGIAVAWGNQLKNVVMEGAAFIDTMTTVKVISQATDEQSKILGKTAKALGESTMLYARDVASGMQYLAMSGNKAEEINNMIKSAAHMAVATNMALGGKGGTADLMTNVMHTFNLAGEEAARVVGDQLTKAAMSSNMSMTDLAETIKYSAADMVLLKQSLPQVAAMAGVLGNMGIQASMAGTALSNMARYFNKAISNPSYKGSKALQKMGLGKEDFVDAKGDLLDFGIILGKVQEALKGATSTEVNATLLDIFGVRGMRAGAALMNNLGSYKDILNKVMYQSDGFMEDIVEKRMATLAGSLDQMVSTLENIRIAFTESLGPVLIPIFKTLTWVFGKVKALFEIPFIGTAISSIMALGIAVLGVGSAIMFLRTKWLILRNDSQITGANMFTLLRGGWEGARLKAERYMAVENAIIAQRKAGIAGNVPYAVSQAMGNGTIINGVRQAKDKTGKMRYYKQNDAGKWTRIGAALGVGYIASANSSQVAEGVMGGTSKVGSKLIGDATTKMGGGALLKTLGGTLGKIFGFMTGPWGFAISMLATVGIPLITSAIKNHKKSLEDATDSTDNLATVIQKDINQRLAEKDDPKRLSLIEEMRVLVQAIQYWSKNTPTGRPQTIVLNVDGKETIRQIIQEEQSDIEFNTNTK